MDRAVVTWDADGTLWYSIYDINFEHYLHSMGYEWYVSTHRINKNVVKSDVNIILTGRFSSMRILFRRELENMGFYPETIIMNPYDNRFINLQWKASVLNEMRADFYIDDDPIMCRKLQPYVPLTQCLSVEEYYG